MLKISKDKTFEFNVDIPEIREIIIELKQMNKNLELLNKLISNRR